MTPANVAAVQCEVVPSQDLTLPKPGESGVPPTPETLDELVNQSLPAVRSLANRLISRVPTGVEIDDLVQAGVIGLRQSADRFDPRRGVSFHTYAYRRVQGAMLDYLRSLDWKPRPVRIGNRKLRKAFHDVQRRLGARACEENAAEEKMESSLQELGTWMNASADLSSDPAGEEAGGTHQLDRPAHPGDSLEGVTANAETYRAMVQAVSHLPKNERLVLSLYYYEQLTMQEIAEVLGVRQARISQLRCRGVSRLRMALRRRAPLSLRARTGTRSGGFPATRVSER